MCRPRPWMAVLYFSVLGRDSIAMPCGRTVGIHHSGRNAPPARGTNSINHHQMRRNSSSELSSTVVAVRVITVFMSASRLFSSMRNPYNNFCTKQGGEAVLCEYSLNSQDFESAIRLFDLRDDRPKKESQSIQRWI